MAEPARSLHRFLGMLSSRNAATRFVAFVTGTGSAILGEVGVGSSRLARRPGSFLVMRLLERPFENRQVPIQRLVRPVTRGQDSDAD